MKFTKKKIIIASVVLVAAVVGVSMKMRTNTASTTAFPVVTTPVEKKTIEESISLKAPLEGTESVDISSNLHYEVLQIYVKEGDKVKKDQVLAVLDKSKLQEEIIAARDNLELAKMQLNERVNEANEAYALAVVQLEDALDDRQKEYDKAMDDLEEATRQYQNADALFKVGAASKESVTQAKLAMDACQRVVDGFTVENGKVVATEAEKQALTTAASGFTLSDGKLVASESDLKSIEIAQRDLDRKLEDLEECEIKSSIDGTVTRVYSKVGRFADDTSSSDPQPMFVIENIDNLQMKVDVSEYDIDKIQVGQNVTISADILGDDTVKAVVSRISPTGEQSTNSSGTVERVIPTQIDVLEQNTKLIAGITATAKIEIASAEQALVVPIEALMENEDGSSAVYRVNAQNQIEIIPVTLGVENDFQVQVISDKLSEGDNIVMTPDYSLTEGMTVTPNVGM